jgi:hypothetical protein
MTTSTQPVHVFLLHAHKDRKAVHKLHARLTRAGIHAWLDSNELKPGQDWRHEIRRAILKSDAILVCLSHDFNKQHGYRHEELKIALDKAGLLADDEIFIIPVRLEACEMPEALQHLHRVDLFEPGGYKKLIHALQERI